MAISDKALFTVPFGMEESLRDTALIGSFLHCSTPHMLTEGNTSRPATPSEVE